MKKKKLLAELILTFLFFTVSLYYIHTKELRVDQRLIIQIKAPYEDTYQLYIDDEKPLNANVYPSRDFQSLIFELPSKKIKNIKLTLGKKPGIIVFESIKLKSLLSHYQWNGNRIKKLLSKIHLRGKNYVKNNYFYIQTIGSEPFIIMDEKFSEFIDKTSRKKIFFYLLSLFLSIFIFYLIHFFNPRGFRIFLDCGVITNMTLLFLVILYFPLLDRVFTIVPKSHLEEKRKIATKPDFRFDTIFQYSKQYTHYHKDHFTMRSRLIYWNNLFKVKILGISPVPKVLIGKNGWLFFDKPGNQPGTIDYYRSLIPFSIPQLEQWKNLLEERHQWLASRGIYYLFFIAPNKNTVYPEFMPDYIRKVHPASRMDQLVGYLKKYSTVPILDLRKALIIARTRYPVYLKTGTHWNDYGAYIVYREIMKYISGYFEEAVLLPLSRFKFEAINRIGGDLAKLLALQEEVLREDFIKIEADPPLTATGGSFGRTSNFTRQGYTECKNARLPNILMVHDSFYKRLKPLLSEQFSRVLYIWDWDMNFYPEIIEREKPKLLIDEIAERFLSGKIPVNPISLKK